MATTALGLILAGGLAFFSGLMVMGIVWPVIYGILKRRAYEAQVSGLRQ